MLKNKQFIRIVLAFVAASIVFAILSLLQGASAFTIFAKLTDGWIFGILVMIAYDVITRLVTDKDAIGWVYLVVVGLLFINVTTFSFASETDNPTVLAVCMGVSVFSGIAAIVFPAIVAYFKAKRANDAHRGEDEARADMQEEWCKLRAKLTKLSPEAKKQKLYKFLVFKLKDNNIQNDLDFNAPLISYPDGEGNSLCYSVNAALNTRELPYELVDNAKKYIDVIVG